MESFHVLFIVTSADRMGDKATGSWLEEVAAPYYTFRDARCEVTFASPAGGRAPVDAESLQDENTTAATRRFEADAAASGALETTLSLDGLDLDAYDAVYFPGGHGTMLDFPADPNVKAVVEHFYAAGKPLSAVCHGPACFVNARKPNGEPLIAGHRFTCFTDEEETIVGLADAVPFMLEARLREQGGVAHCAQPFVSNVVVEGALITGQNPASSIPVAEAVIHAMRNYAAKDAA